MKKFLYLTTALICTASNSFADFDVSLHGKYKTQMVARTAKKIYSNLDPLSSNNANYSLDSAARVALYIKEKLDNKNEYGANIVLTTPTQDNFKLDKNIEKSYLFYQSSMGRLEMGSNFDAGTIMDVGASRLAAAVGGASDGDWSDYIPDPDIQTNSRSFGTSSFAPLTNGVSYLYRKDKSSTALKLSYFTPVYAGLQFGLSFIPDMSNTGLSTGPSNNNLSKLKNVLSLASTYQYKFHDFDIVLSGSYVKGKRANTSRVDKYYNLKDYNLGGMITKDKISLAASYGNSGKSLHLIAPNRDAKQHYLTLGVGYKCDKLNSSLTYLSSQSGYSRKSLLNPLTTLDYTTKLSALSFGVDYLLFSGLKIYSELTRFSISNERMQGRFSIKSGQAHPKNNGLIFIAGSMVSI